MGLVVMWDSWCGRAWATEVGYCTPYTVCCCRGTWGCGGGHFPASCSSTSLRTPARHRVWAKGEPEGGASPKARMIPSCRSFTLLQDRMGLMLRRGYGGGVRVGRGGGTKACMMAGRKPLYFCLRTCFGFVNDGEEKGGEGRGGGGVGACMRRGRWLSGRSSQFCQHASCHRDAVTQLHPRSRLGDEFC